MNSILARPFHPKSITLWLALAGMCAGAGLAPAAPGGSRAELRGLLGRAQYSHGGAAFQPVAKGTAFEAGDVIQTAAGAALDVDFGGAAGVVRLTESSTLVIEQWSAGEAGEDLRLFLRDGEMLGRVTKAAGKSRLEIKVNAGLGKIVEGQFRLNARGYLVLLEGKGGFVQVPAGGEPVAHVLDAPPAVYFAPGDGVRPAPEQLVKEVTKQWRSKLPKR